MTNIIGKLSTFGTIKHAVKTVDYQPSVNNGVIAFINGDLYIDGSENPVKFAQVFHLQVGGPSGYYCLNDVFRLNYG